MISGGTSITSGMLHFIKNNVLSITDLTRTNKLAEILDSFANRKSEDIFIVQNSRNKDSQGALVDVDLLMELLMIREFVDQAAERIVEGMAVERVHAFNPNKSLTQLLHENDIEIDVDEILRFSEKVELE